MCRVRTVLGWVVVAAASAHAEDIEPFDADGDGDIDADDVAVIKAAEEIEIVDKSEGQKLRESARAVTVIDTRQAKERTADLGEVLSRAQGIQVRRSGGLGSSARLSLNGLYDDQVRFFIDGVPLELAGWGLGIANVPVESVQRIDVHRGVVPIALGADALGGAIDLVTDPSWISKASASYQIGSFGTHRVSMAARARDPKSGLVGGLSLFLDRAENNYMVDVEVADRQGRISQARVPRFHDAYAAAGASAEVGVVQRGPIERAIVRVFTTDFDKELQHNIVMTVPYGDITYGGTTRGALADVALAKGNWRGRVLVGGARRWLDFNDQGDAVYDWYGNEVRERGVPGELGSATFQRLRETGLFARLVGERRIGDRQVVRIATAPTFTSRRGTDFLLVGTDEPDVLRARNDLFQVVSGVEHELQSASGRIENIAFGKHYTSVLRADDVSWMGVLTPVDRTTQHVGVGDMLRVQLSKRFMAKASYEWSTRLPGVDEVFGDGVVILANPELKPERSHNINLGGRFDDETRFGAVQVDTNAFARLTDDMILLLGSDRTQGYDNVFAAHIFGIETGASWIAPGEWASLEASVTLQDIRNASSEGTFGMFDGDRIPNRPWLLGALSGTVRRKKIMRPDDELALFANSRYVQEFFRGWESAGRRDTKQVIATQLAHSAGLSYAVRNKTPIVSTVEVQNLLDARVFDSFGVQKPGRAFYFKLAVEM